MIGHLSLDALRAFAAFAECLNFTHAAERLNISQPALHVKIQELSKTLEVALYVRQGRRLLLTAKGQELALFAREMEDRLASFGEDFQGRGGQHPVVLAAGQGAYLYLLGPALQSYIEQSQARLKLLTLDRERCLEAVTSARAHLGVAALEAPPDDLRHQLIARICQVLVVPAGSRLARRRTLHLRDLEGMTLVVPPADRPHRQILASALQTAGVSWKVGVEANGWELMLHFATLGLGAAVVNSFCSMPRGLVARPLEGLPEVHYYLFWRGGYLRPQAEILRRLIAS